MNSLMYILAFFSGLLYGILELIIAHRRMKLEAIKNFWGIIYLICTSLISCGIFIILSNRSPALFNFSQDIDINNWVISIFAGPFTGIALRHIGGKGKGSTILVSFHDKIFTFLRQEVKHSVDIKRIELSKEVSIIWKDNITELGNIASEYINSVDISEKSKTKESEYIKSLIEEGSGLLIARYLIENYGNEWVKKQLILKK